MLALYLPEISLDNLTYNKLAGGTIELTWETQGETDNPYLGGFKIFKLLSISQNDATFPDPEIETNSNVWEQLLSDEPKDSIPVLSDSCRSNAATYRYLRIVCHCSIEQSRRTGHDPYTRFDGSGGRVSNVVMPLPLQPKYPHLHTPIDLPIQAIVSTCSEIGMRAYEVNLTWEWPASGEDDEVTWNMYRMDVEPSNVDLKLVTPAKRV